MSNGPEFGSQPNSVALVIIHGNGEAEPGWINASVVDRLTTRLAATGKGGALKLEPSSRVTELAEPDRETSFKAYVRSGELNGTNVAFAELNWADLSRVGSDPLSQLVTALRLFHESPSLLTRLFLPPCPYLFHNVLSAIIQFAVWLVRWLIAGFNGALFGAVFAVLLVRALWKPIGEAVRPYWPTFPEALERDSLNVVLLAVLVVLAIGCRIAASRVRSEDYGLSQILTATSTFASLGIVAVTVVNYVLPHWLPHVPILRPTTLEGYINHAILFNFGVAALWDLVAVVGSAMWALLAIKRLLLKRPPDAPPFHRVSAALALAIIQAVVWKVAVPIFGVVTINVALDDSLQAAATRISAVGILNSVLLLLAMVVCILLLISGSVAQFILRLKPQRLAPFVPRVAISSVLVLILVFAACANLFLDYLNLYVAPTNFLAGEPRFSDWLRSLCGNTAISSCISDSPALRLGVAAVGLGLGALFLFGIVQQIFMGVLHFARDIVDHQYRQPRASGMSAGAETGFPRRDRIRQRLRSLMTEVLGRQTHDRLVFVTHSQGTVIAFDCLRSSSAAAPDIESAGEVHLVTVGSPITHLYQHYFGEYSNEGSGASDSRLAARLSSWTNLWRIDDPIGRANRMSASSSFTVENIPMKAGGHNDYWREDEVCDVILRLISQPMKRSA